MHLTKHQLARLDAAVSCPFDAKAAGLPLGVQRVLYRCWHALLCKHLPDALFAGVLVGDWGHPCRSIWRELDPDDGTAEDNSEAAGPEPTNSLLQVIESHELDQILVPLEGSRKDLAERRRDKPHASFRDDVGAGDAGVDPVHEPLNPSSYLGTWLDEDFGNLTGWLQRLHLVTDNVRTKHWPPSRIKTLTQLLELSRTRADEGWLHIDANEQRLRECCLAALACHVEEELERRESTPTGRADRAAVFLTVWDELFFTGSFRIGVNHRTDMGAAQGAMAKGVVYDVCPSASQFHCFPVQTHPSSVRSIFAESILDF